MIAYRTFWNSDPPRLVKLWHECQLGRGAAEGFRVDAFEAINFSRTYFDREGVIIAWDEETGDPVGYVHAGFGSNKDRSALDHSIGVICVVMVLPEYREQGIGRELVSRAERYLTQRGAVKIRGGEASPHDPFYMGLYGGTKPAGFLESDAAARPFFEKLGYVETERRAIYFCDFDKAAMPMNMQIRAHRRNMQLTVTDRLPDRSWWSYCRFANLDYIRFLLSPKNGEDAVAGVTVVGLDFYLAKWDRRVVGMTEVFVVDDYRGQGVGQALLIEVSRRLKEELITGAEAHTREDDEAGIRLLESSGFYRVDTGIIYEKQSDPDAASIFDEEETAEVSARQQVHFDSTILNIPPAKPKAD